MMVGTQSLQRIASVQTSGPLLVARRHEKVMEPQFPHVKRKQTSIHLQDFFKRKEGGGRWQTDRCLGLCKHLLILSRC